MADKIKFTKEEETYIQKAVEADRKKRRNSLIEAEILRRIEEDRELHPCG